METKELIHLQEIDVVKVLIKVLELIKLSPLPCP